MRTNRGTLVQSSFAVTMHRNELQPTPHYCTLAISNFIGRGHFAAREKIAILRDDIGIFARITVRSAKCLAARIIKFLPRIGTSENQVANEHGAERAVGHPIPGVASQDVDVFLARIAPEIAE